MWTESPVESAKQTSRVQFVQPVPSEVSPSVGGLIRAAGHELRNKLGVINNSVYYLNMKLGHGDERLQKHLRMIGGEIADANRIIADLEYSTLVDKPVLRKSDIKAILAEALSRASLPDRWEATICLDDGLPPPMADAIQLQTAFTNIILRIVEGVPEGGKLQIIARKQDGFVEIGFGATGFVVSEENLAAIVDPFVSAGGPSNLGMFVSKRLVERHGGTIGVRSLARERTMLTVRLPLPSEGTTKHEQETEPQ